MDRSAPAGKLPERRLVDHWARLERELIEDSTRRIHEFERRLELEWEALRQLHEEKLRTQASLESRLRAALAVLAVALASAIALAVYGYATLSERTSAAERSAREAQELGRRDVAAMKRSVSTLAAESQTAVRSAERTLHVLAAADVRRFPLFGLGTSQAAGHALWSRSRGAVLDAAGVPQPPTGEAHQAWLVTPREVTSLGFVAPDREGRVRVTFDPPPVLPGIVVAVVVTTEPSSGSRFPGNRVVLTSREP